MKTIIISPWSRDLRDGKLNAKNYGSWPELVVLLRQNGYKTIQVGVTNEKLIGADEVKFNLPVSDLADLIKSCDLWISVDNFINHYASYLGKRGIALWGVSDPKIFGYEKNINLLKSRSYLRPDQFGFWEGVPYNKEAFVEPEVVLKQVEKFSS